MFAPVLSNFMPVSGTLNYSSGVSFRVKTPHRTSNEELARAHAQLLKIKEIARQHGIPVPESAPEVSKPIQPDTGKGNILPGCEPRKRTLTDRYDLNHNCM